MDATTNTNPFSNVAIINPEEKKKPHNIKIKNHNKNEPKINKVNIKRSAQQKFRTYRTIIEPNLHNKILINETDDIVAKIKKAFGLAEPANTNYSKMQVAENTFSTMPSAVNEIPATPIRRGRGQSYTSSKGSDSDLEIFKDYDAPTIFSRWDKIDRENTEREERYKKLSAAMRGAVSIESLQRITAPEISDISAKDAEELTGQISKSDEQFVRENVALNMLNDALFRGQVNIKEGFSNYKNMKAVKKEIKDAIKLNSKEDISHVVAFDPRVKGKK